MFNEDVFAIAKDNPARPKLGMPNTGDQQQSITHRTTFIVVVEGSVGVTARSAQELQ